MHSMHLAKIVAMSRMDVNSSARNAYRSIREVDHLNETRARRYVINGEPVLEIKFVNARYK